MAKSLTAMLWRALRGLLRFVLAIVVLFEEWGWAWFGRVMGYIGRLPVLRAIERWIANLPPYGALVMLIAPGLLLLPVKLLALYFIGKGRAVFGISVILIAKVLGTALVARIFQLIHPALMRLPWFVPLYARWTRYKAALLAWVRESAAFRAARAIKLRMRRLFRRSSRGGK